MEQTSNERSEVARVFAEQRPEVQEVIKAVLKIERDRLHLRRREKDTLEILTDAVRRVFE